MQRQIANGFCFLWEQLRAITNLQTYLVAHMHLVVSNTKQEEHK